jgi:hypothetical protein
MIGSALQAIANSALVSRPQRLGVALIDRLEIALASRPVWLAAIIALFALQCALIVTHWPWFDEVQALLIALQSPTLPDLLANLRYEGHPPLWYLVLRGLGLVLDPQWILPVAVAIPALIAQACILLRSPFTRAERILLASGEVLLFEFFTVSRGASLGACLIILALTFWRNRGVWLAIAALPVCGFLFGLISLALIALRAAERRLSWLGMTLWAVCAACAAWAVRPEADIVPALAPQGLLLEAAQFALRLGGLLLPIQANGIAPQWDGDPPLSLGLVLGLGFLGFAWHVLRHNRLHRGLLFGLIAVMLVFSCLVYPLPIRHMMLIAVLLIALVWLAAADGRPLSAVVRLWLFTGSLCGLLVAAIGLVRPFDTAHLAAREIERLGLTEQPWVAFPDSRGPGVPISLLNGMEFERPEVHCRQSFVRWNYRTSIQAPNELLAYLGTEATRRGRFYLISQFPITGASPDLVQPLASIPAGYNGIEHHLYAIAPFRPAIGTPVPRCNGPVRPLSAARLR